MRNGTQRKLVIVLDHKNWQEVRFHQDLVHGAGELLRFMLKRMSLPRESWTHTYCYHGEKREIPSKKKERLTFLRDSLTSVNKFLIANRPCIIVGMGKLACEHLTGHSVIKDKAGTCWETPDHGSVWITYAPDAALFDPVLCVSLYGVLFKAAERASINPVFNPNVLMFNWLPYLKGAKQ